MVTRCKLRDVKELNVLYFGMNGSKIRFLVGVMVIARLDILQVLFESCLLVTHVISSPFTSVHSYMIRESDIFYSLDILHFLLGSVENNGVARGGHWCMSPHRRMGKKN